MNRINIYQYDPDNLTNSIVNEVIEYYQQGFIIGTCEKNG
jgi:hypothetical protein